MPLKVLPLAHALVAGLALVAATPSQALRRSHDGAGQAVLVPYYSVVDDRATLLSIVNHADTPKAVRFVLAEGRNGRAVLTFNIYLAALDTWTGALTFDSTGARLSSNDDTCTVPSIPSAGVALRNFAYTGSANDNLGTDVARLREGQFEAIEMGVPQAEVATFVNQRNCAALIQRFTTPDGIWSTSPNSGLAAPSGQLSASALLVDVAAGSAFDVPSLALNGFGDRVRHMEPGQVGNLRFGNPTPLANQSQFVVEGSHFVSGNQPADAVSLLLMAASMESVFSVDPGLAATTEYVVAFPTRNYYLDDRPGGVLGAGAAPIAPFSNPVGTGIEPRCNEVTWETIARNGTIVGTDTTLPTPINDGLCAQVNHVPLTRNLPPVPGHRPLTTRNENNGRLRLGLRPDLHALSFGTGPGGNSVGTLQGLPVLIVPLIEAQNTAAQPGKLATYGYTGPVVRRQTGTVDF